MEDLLGMFEPEIQAVVKERIKKRKPDAVVVMEVRQMDATAYGNRSVLLVGGQFTYTLSDVLQPGFRLGDVPSRHEYPVAYALVTP